MSPILRILDVFLALIGLIALFPALLLIYVIGLVDTGAPLFRQIRVGQEQKPFVLTKFRTMKPGTDSVATHLVSSMSITPLGRVLRATKLDELPQLWNVLKGEMSLVGPRPCLPEQRALVGEREALGVYKVRPGITGLAQIQGVDMSTPEQLAAIDAEMVRQLSVGRYFYYIFLTVVGKGLGDRVRVE